MSCNKASDVWKFFTKVNKTEAQCSLCLKKLKTGGGTSNLRQHLQHKHSRCINPTGSRQSARENETETDNEKLGKSLSNNHNENSDSEEQNSASASASMSPCSTRSTTSTTPTLVRSRSPTPTPSNLNLSSSSSTLTSTLSFSNNVRLRKKQRQMTLAEVSERAISFERGGQRDTQITNALIFMICKDNAPHAIVEKEGFSNFIKILSPLYKLPSRNTVTHMVSSRYSAIINTLKANLNDVQYFSLTSDICTVVNTSRSFLVVTAHYICPLENVLETIMLGVRGLTESHTGEYIASEIEQLLGVFQIPKSKIVSICTDGGANMVASVKKLCGEGKNVYCLAHLLNLVVNDGLEDTSNPKLKELISEVKNIVTFGRHSNLFMDALRVEQEKEGTSEGRVLLLIQSVPTRWNSTYDCLKRFLELSPYIARVLASPNLKKAPRMISGSEIEVLTELLNILKPFKEATIEISGSDYITGSLCIPLLCIIESALSKSDPMSPIAVSLQIKLQTCLSVRMKPFMSNPLLCHAVLVDPRFKKMYMSHVIASQAASQIGKEVKKCLRDLGKISPPAKVVGENISETNSIWSTHDAKLANTVSSSSFLDSNPDSLFPSELKLYLQQPVVPRNESPLQFWGQSKTTLPALASIARKYLTVVGSSVSSERLVSTVNAVVSDERSRLTNEHITERVFLTRINKKYWRD